MQIYNALVLHGPGVWKLGKERALKVQLECQLSQSQNPIQRHQSFLDRMLGRRNLALVMNLLLG